MNAKMTPYDRACPRCAATFRAVTERGICPHCQLFSMIRRDGTFVATRELFTALDEDEPFGEGPLANLYSAASDGGAPLIEACRHEGFPAAGVCHAELRKIFYSLKSLLETEVPIAEFKAIREPSLYPEWTGAEHEKSIEALILSWDDDEHRIDLVCLLTDEGGRIDLLRDGTMSFDRRE